VSQDMVDGMTEELARVGRDPNGVFFWFFTDLSTTPGDGESAPDRERTGSGERRPT
jgi:hypothetical protein